MQVKKAVFPVAGLGTRFLPATKASPKEMLALIDKPLVQYVVEEAVAAGIEQILFVTGRGKRALEDHFDIAFELEALLYDKGKDAELSQVREIAEMVDIFYVRQKQALGLGHAILCARDFIGNEPFAVLLGDDIIDDGRPCLGQLLDVYRKYRGTVLALEQVPMANISFIPSSGWRIDSASAECSKSRTGARTSYSTLIRASAARAVFSSSAATIATSSPTYRTYSSRTNLSWGLGSG